MTEEKDKSVANAEVKEPTKKVETPAEEPKTEEKSTEESQQTTGETKAEEAKKDQLAEVKESAPSTDKDPKTEAKKETRKEPEREIPELKPGMTVRVHQKIKEKNPKGEEKERVQIFEGIIIAKKHGNEAGGTITVRKVSGGIGVEKIFPLNLPTIVKIEPIKQAGVRRAKLYFLRKGFKKRLKEILLKK